MLEANESQVEQSDQEQVQEEIRQLLSSSGFSRSKLTAMLKEIAPEAEKKVMVRATREPCTTYREIKKNYTCLHCGATFSKTITLSKREDTAVISKDLRVTVINSKSPAEIECATFSCPDCTAFIKKMTREEIESRYLKLLSCTAGWTYNPFGNIVTIEEKEVRI